MKTICKFTAAAAVTVVLCLPALNAQENGHFGIRAGFQTAQLTSDIGSLLEANQNRYFVGLYKDSPIMPVLNFSAGLEYYETGSRNGLNDLKLGYLSVPVALKADIGLLNVYGGVSGAYRLYANEHINGEEIDVPNDKYGRFDYSTFVGGGVNILFIGIDIRRHWGKKNVIEGFRNGFWQLGATLRF